MVSYSSDGFEDTLEEGNGEVLFVLDEEGIEETLDGIKGLEVAKQVEVQRVQVRHARLDFLQSKSQKETNTRS